MSKDRLILGLFGLILFFIIIFGLFWLAGYTGRGVSLWLTFAAGISMIFLPCTLPLVFVIVPLTLTKSPSKGFLMAVLFGLGLAITLAFYGILVAQLGKYLGLDRFTQFMFLFAGLIALIFGWTELNFLRFKLPEFSSAPPSWLLKKNDYFRSFFLGLFLGNAGVGCPNPAFYVILTYLASIGSLTTGAIFGFVHGLGRLMPLLFLVILAILGINATNLVANKKALIDKIMGWALVLVGAFILTYGLWGMHWWEDSIFHASWNQLIYQISPNLAEDPDHPVKEGVLEHSFFFGWLTFLLPVMLSILYWWWQEKKINKLSLFLFLFLVLLLILALVGLLEVSHGHGLV